MFDGVVGSRRRDKVSWNDLRPLVQKLIEGVLAVCSRRAPDDRLRDNGPVGQKSTKKGKGGPTPVW